MTKRGAVNSTKIYSLNMPYFSYVKQKKQNTFRVHWLWSVFVFSRLGIKERCQGIIISIYSQKKSCFFAKSESGFRNFVLKGYHLQKGKRYPNTL